LVLPIDREFIAGQSCPHQEFGKRMLPIDRNLIRNSWPDIWLISGLGGKPLLSVILVVGGKSLEKRCWGEKLSMMTPGFPQAYVFRVGG
jgi:hypothetical protein